MGGLFPVQSVTAGDGIVRIHDELMKENVRCLLLRDCPGVPRRLGFIMRADHHPREVENAATVLGNILAGRKRRPDCKWQSPISGYAR
jgi:hypothetical protein